jgi:hypothetical protein
MLARQPLTEIDARDAACEDLSAARAYASAPMLRWRGSYSALPLLAMNRHHAPFLRETQNVASRYACWDPEFKKQNYCCESRPGPALASGPANVTCANCESSNVRMCRRLADGILSVHKPWNIPARLASEFFDSFLIIFPFSYILNYIQFSL